MIAIKRLQNILWILLVAFGALSAYLISLKVATERNAVLALDRKIAKTRADIRYLETEFEARASMRQLERWNADDYRYVAPQSAQYLPDERSLASLDGVQANGDTYVAPPVMMAMADSAADPAPEAAAAAPAAPAPQPVREQEAIIRAAVDRQAAPAPKPASVVPVAAATPSRPRLAAALAKPKEDPGVARKAARMAMLDQTLLDERTLRDLDAKAAAEGHGRGGR